MYVNSIRIPVKLWLSLLFLLTACGQNRSTEATIVAEKVLTSVAQTVEARPSQTPLPTFTEFPTSTPTSTEIPTPSPTTTPIPTKEPTPTLIGGSSGKLIFQAAYQNPFNEMVYMISRADLTKEGLEIDLTGIAEDDEIWGLSISPSGYQIAFAGYRDGNYDILVVDANMKSTPRNLTNNPNYYDVSPKWSPDGRKIGFISNRDGGAEIYIIDAISLETNHLTNNSLPEQSLSWSPDGNYIAFNAGQDDISNIYSVNIDGTDQRQLTNDSTSYTPAWSPDGKLIAYSSLQKGDDYDIFIMESDGSSQRRIISNSKYKSQPAWSPDGQWIAFITYQFITYESGFYSISLMKSDGTQIKEITSIYTGSCTNPSWWP